MELKRIKLWLGLAVLAVLLLAVVTVLADELIVNGTFDTDLDGWNFGELVGYTTSYDHTGNDGGSMIIEAYNDPDSCAWQSITNQPGSLSISAWARAESDSTFAAILIWIDDGGSEISVEVSDSWQNLTLNETIPAGQPVVVLYVCNLGVSESPNAIFDDISVDFQPAPPPPTFNELSTYAITTYGLVAITLVLSEQLARLLYYAMWRLRR